jgi:hypothetical protein
MPEDEATHRREVEAMQARREDLVRQIKQSQETIERSQGLIRRIDEILAKAADKPQAASLAPSFVPKSAL